MSCATRHCFSVVRSEINASEGGKLSKCVKSGKYSVIPTKARIHRPTTSMPEKDTPSFPKTLRHSREGGNDGIFFSGVGVVGQWIPQPAPGVADVGNAIDVIVAEYPVASGDHFIQPVETFDCPDQPESLQQSSRQLPQNTCYKIGFEIGYVS